MKTKRILFFLLMAMLCVVLGACGGNKCTPDETVKRDIEACEEVQSCYNSKLTIPSKYRISDYQIEKRQTNMDAKQDLVYANVAVENDNFRVQLSVRCEYDFYDEGGWVLKNCAIENVGAVTPVAGPHRELAMQYVRDKLNGKPIYRSYEEEPTDEMIVADDIGYAEKTELQNDGKSARVYIILKEGHRAMRWETRGSFEFLFRDNEWQLEEQALFYVDECIKAEGSMLGLFKESSESIGYTENTLEIVHIYGTHITYNLTLDKDTADLYNARTGESIETEFNPATKSFVLEAQNKEHSATELKFYLGDLFYFDSGYWAVSDFPEEWKFKK